MTFYIKDVIINKHKVKRKIQQKSFEKIIKKNLKNYWQISTICANINKYFAREKIINKMKELVIK